MSERINHRKLNWKDRLYIIIFESDTPAGRAFDIALLWLILISILLVSLESVPSLNLFQMKMISYFEWAITILFTLEYMIRVIIVRNKKRYLVSFFGVVDLLAILPTYLSLFIPGTQFALMLRIFRLLRVFRILKLGKYIGESYLLLNALKASRYKITVFLEGVLIVVVLVGTLMYIIEGETSGFNSIPESIYWAIVTLTTVGFGDIAPVTPLGRAVASMLMLLGYGVIAVPTGIVSAELSKPGKPETASKECNSCLAKIDDQDADYCKYCGTKL
jgi:voltage-gated potassium channel